MAESKSLVRKLAEVMAGLSRLEKRGYNSAHSYKYLLEADVMEAVRSALGERTVFLTHQVLSLVERDYETSKGSKMRVVRVELAVTAHDGESGESMEVARTFGEASDSLDKAVYKAITGAWKYALMKLFLVSSGDDPEVERKKVTAQAPAPSGAVLPKFGEAAGQPVAGQPLATLEYYHAALLRSVADPNKAQFKAKNQALVTAIEKEMEAQRTAKAAPPKPTPAQVKAENEALEARKAKVKVAAEALAKECGVDVSEVGKALRAKGVTSMGEMTPDSWTAFEKEFRTAHGFYIKALNLTREAGLFMQTLEEWCVGNGIKTPAQFTAEHLASWTARVSELTAQEPGAQG